MNVTTRIQRQTVLWVLLCLSSAATGSPLTVSDPLDAGDWDKDALSLVNSTSVSNVIVRSHNGWVQASHPPTSANTATVDQFVKRWGLEAAQGKSAFVGWSRDWFRRQPADVPVDWHDRLRIEQTLTASTALQLLDGGATPEQRLTLALLAPRHRPSLERISTGITASALHFVLKLSSRDRRIATAYPAPAVFSIGKREPDMGLVWSELSPETRQAGEAISEHYYRAARVPGVPAPPDGNWAALPRSHRPSVLPSEPIYVFLAPPDQRSKDSLLSLRTYRPLEPPLHSLWYASDGRRTFWDISVPTLPTVAGKTGWSENSVFSLSAHGAGGDRWVKGLCLTRAAGRVVPKLGELIGERWRVEPAIADQTLTLVLKGIRIADLKSGVAEALHAQWRTRQGAQVLELTDAARKKMAESDRPAVATSWEALSNATERVVLKRDLNDELPPARRDELEALEGREPGSYVRMSLREFPPHLQRRILDQGHYERWWGDSRNYPAHLRVDISRMDEAQVSYRWSGGRAVAGLFRLPLVGGGFLEY